MNRINLKLAIKKCTIYYGLLGLAIGIIMFIVTIVNPTVPFHVGETQYYGLTAGILGLVFTPLVMGLVGFFHALLLWYPIIALYRYFKGKTK
jgi:hypothetical protein